MPKKYDIPEDKPQMVSESISMTLTEGQSEQVEALWTLIKNQGTMVQQSLLERLNSFFKKGAIEVETTQHIYVKESLHRAFEDMRMAKANNSKESQHPTSTP